MAFREVGVRAVVKDIGKFKRDAGDIQIAITQIVNSFNKTSKAATSGLGAMTLAFGAAQIAANALTSVIRGVTRALGNMASAALEGAATFQKLEIRFEGLIKNEILSRDSTLEMADAIEIAADRSKELLGWIQQLAVTTPFTRRDISETIAFSMAMGFSSEEAKKLTTSIGDFVAGMGLSSDVMERIILQFGQMRAGGKLFGTELRDLARGAFVPVNDILEEVGKRFGMLGTEWQELAARGQVDLMPFFQEFVKMADTRFAGAMDRMNKTLEAVRQNIGEFIKEFIGVRALGPGLRRFTDAASGALDDLLSPDVLEAFVILGKQLDSIVAGLLDMTKATLKAIFGTTDLKKIVIGLTASLSIFLDGVISVGNELKDVGESFVEDFGNSMRDVARDALQWGVEISTELASGIVTGASTAIVAALNFISDTLNEWLAPGSPPKIAPDLPAWGAAALTEWLKGFELADFSVLKAVQAPIRGALDILRLTGELTKEEVGPLFADLSRILIEGLSIDEFGEDIFERIRQATGEFGDEINELIRSELALYDAIRAVEEAERLLAASRDTFDEQSLKVRELTREYNELLRTGSDPAILRAKLAEINAAENAREVAREQIGAAEDALEAAEDGVDPLREQTRMQEELLRQLIAISKAQLDIAGAGLDGGLEGVGGLFGDIDEDAEELNGTLGDIFRDMKENIKEAFKDLFQPFVDEWENEMEPALGEMDTAFLKFREKTMVPLGEKIRDFQENELRDFTLAWGELALKGVVKTEIALWRFRVKTLNPLKESIKSFQENELTDFWAWWAETIVTALGDAELGFQNINLWALIPLKNFIRDELMPELKKLSDWFSDAFMQGVDVLVDVWENTLKPVLEDIAELINDTFTGPIMRWVIENISKRSDFPIPKSGGKEGGTKDIAPTVSALPTSSQTNVSFGDTNINDQMDAATFAAMVQQAVAGAL